MVTIYDRPNQIFIEEAITICNTATTDLWYEWNDTLTTSTTTSSTIYSTWLNTATGTGIVYPLEETTEQRISRMQQLEAVRFLADPGGSCTICRRLPPCVLLATVSPAEASPLRPPQICAGCRRNILLCSRGVSLLNTPVTKPFQYLLLHRSPHRRCRCIRYLQ
jgi:hypothetical protein